MVEVNMSRQPWPEDWPKYRNGVDFCDMLVGPCNCGATHQSGEFGFDGERLFRYGKPVVIKNGPMKFEERKMPTLEELENQRDVIDLRIKKLKNRAKIEALFEPNVVMFKIFVYKEYGEPRILRFSKREEISKLKATLVEILDD